MRLQITKNWFEIYPEKALLPAGTVFFVVGSLLGYFLDARYDGVIDVHYAEDVPLYRPFLDNLVNTVCLFAALFAAGKIINRNTRAVDILSAALLSRFVFYVIPLFNINDYMSRLTEGILSSMNENGFAAGELPNIAVVDVMVLMLFALLSLALLVLFVVILYRGFKTATNSKTIIHKVYFAVGILLAEILSKVVLYFV